MNVPISLANSCVFTVPDDEARPAHAHPKATDGRDSTACASADSVVDFGYSTPAGETSHSAHPLVVIAGPTASGKSALAIDLAERLHGEVVNYDSVQVYRGLDIGSGKVAPAQRHGIPHHLLDALDPSELCTAGNFRRMALSALSSIRRRGKLPILAGGTGLYLRALLKGLFEGPQRSVPLRAKLRRIEARRGKIFLHRMLRRLDPEAASRIHANDAQKAIRAIEIRFLAGAPASGLYLRGREGLEGYRVVKIGLSPSRPELVRRIDLRVERMFVDGLLDETRAVLARLGWQTPGDWPAHPPAALLALGYRQACRVLLGEIGTAEAVRLTQAATRQYAKRQMTWFRRESDVRWFEGFGDDPTVQRDVAAWLGETMRESGS